MMKKNILKISKILYTASAILLFASSGFSQKSRSMAKSQHQNIFGRDLFSYRYYNFADSTDERLSRMDFHVGVVNDVLTFLKTEDGSYKARYEVLVIIYNDRKEPIVEKSTSHRVHAATFGETNMRSNPAYHTISVSLPFGRYKGELQLNDLESGEGLSKELELNFRNFRRDKIHLSDIMFINKIDTTSAGVEYTPNLQHVFDDVNSAFAAYVELYPSKKGKDVEAQFSIFDTKGHKLYTVGRTYPSSMDIVSAVIPFRERLKEPGEYYFIVSVKSGKQTAKIQRMFSVFWGNVPLAKTNLEMAVAQLALVAHKKDVDAMRDASEAERKVLYDEFWLQRDPTPNSQKNELKDEFFSRVDFSNRNFTEITSGRSGWQTDRGKIYVVYGAPDNVDRRDSEMNAPAAETWYYNRLNRKYFFADRNGEGIFRLVKVE